MSENRGLRKAACLSGNGQLSRETGHCPILQEIYQEKMESLNPRVFKVGGTPRALVVQLSHYMVQETEVMRPE